MGALVLVRVIVRVRGFVRDFELVAVAVCADSSRQLSLALAYEHSLMQKQRSVLSERAVAVRVSVRVFGFVVVFVSEALSESESACERVSESQQERMKQTQAEQPQRQRQLFSLLV